jgi:hypothetical protein
MSQAAPQHQLKGVICLFCGKPTQLPTPSEAARAANLADPGHRAAIIRCLQCGREARYLPEEILVFQDAQDCANHRARAVTAS